MGLQACVFFIYHLCILSKLLQLWKQTTKKKRKQKKSTIITNYFSYCQEEHANKFHIGETEGKTQKNNLSQQTAYMNSHFYSASPNICNAVHNLHASNLPEKIKFLVLLDCYYQKVSKERYKWILIYYSMPTDPQGNVFSH